MGQELLLSRIASSLKNAKLSERKALIRADIGLDFVRDMRRRGHSPNVEKLKKLASVVGKPLSYFTDAVGPDPIPTRAQETELIQVVGVVQAGVYRDAMEWEHPEDQFAVSAPTERRLPNVKRFGLLVRGNSMNLLYPDGTVVLVVRFADIGRPLKLKDKVVVLRRSDAGDQFEATLKQYDVDDRGRHVLWPRSSDPDFQTPYILSTSDHVMNGTNAPHLPAQVSAGLLVPSDNVGHDAGEPDIQIVGLVVGSYQPEDI